MNAAPSPQPCVVVHGVQHALAVLGTGRPATLLSARGAALFAGAAWWREVVAQARAMVPVPDRGPACADILDCADAPGLALEAIGLGQGWLVLDGACPALPALARLAASRGGGVLPARPPALDLGKPGAMRRLPWWLDGAGPGRSRHGGRAQRGGA